MTLIGFRRHVGLIEGKIEIFAHVGNGADTLGEALVDHLKVKALEVVLGWVVLFGIPNIGEGTLVAIRGSGFILVSPGPALRHKNGLFGLGPKGLIVIGGGFAPFFDFGGGFGFTLGPVVNLNAGSSIVNKFSLDGNKLKDKYKRVHCNLITVDAMFQLNLKYFSIYAKYSPMNLMDKKYWPEFTTWSIGIAPF